MFVRTCVFVACLSIPVVHFVQDAAGADWPMWRYDAGRTAASPGGLSRQLHPQWVRVLPTPRPAWPPDQDKLQFDLSYEPVVMGKMIFVPSMVSDHLAAWDTETGEEKWRFYTDGPVRFAPVAWRGKVYFVSDDGYLYCLDAASGGLRWKFRGGPSDRKVLGNDRLISMWPARGAPVIYDKTIYFGASIWPFMGTFIHALDAETGKVVWTNSGSGSVYVQQQHYSPAFAGVAPQGYMAATKDKLLVSGGRTVPAGYDRRTGEYLYFQVSDRSFGKDAGGYAVAARKEWFFNRGAVYKLADGSGLMRAWASVLGHRSIFTADGKGHVLAHALSPKKEEFVDRKGKKQTRTVLPKLWEVSTEPVVTRVFIKAGQRLYGSGSDGLVAALDLPRAGGQAKVSWHTRIEGDAWSMLAADRKLFVVTRQGSICCFGPKQSGNKSPRSFEEASSPDLGQSVSLGAGDERSTTAQAVLERTGQKEGYCLVLGAGSGRLMEELLRQSNLHVMALDPDAEKVEALRRKLDEAGLYGRRVAVHAGDILSVELPPYLASLVVSEDLKAAGIGSGRSFVEKVFRALRPYGGTACFATTGDERKTLVRQIETSDLPKAEVNAEQDGLVTLTRAGALPGSADWTHQYADAANTVVSKDGLVRAPLGLLWFGGPSNAGILPRHGHGPSPHVIGGRLFIEGRDIIRAVDVYTGRLLWEKEMKELGKFYDNTSHQPGANEIGSNYVSLADGIYLVTPGSCLRLDPATGRTMKEFTLPGRDDGGDHPRWGFITVWEDLLVATTSPISVSLKEEDVAKQPPRSMTPVIRKNAEWQYLAGRHPKVAWTRTSFTEADAGRAGWKTGQAGFGYGDNDDKTLLKDMEANYTVVYVRRFFDVADVGGVRKLGLMINYDDAFIAYLNGKEVVRANIAKGSGESISGIGGHEAEGYEYFEIKDPRNHLRDGTNVLAIEGHNVNAGSSDFSLDPYLMTALRGNGAQDQRHDQVAAAPLKDIPGVTVNADYASTSSTLVVMDRHDGELLWSRRARYGFRHNAIALGAGRLFCIDGMSESKLASLRRRGWEIADEPTLYALDARTGSELWSTSRDISGTWLGYSAEHDVLVQAGSRGPDRARDEPGHGLAAYRGADGKPIWQRDLEYSGPVMLHHDTLVTQGWALGLLTGREKMCRHPLTGREVNWFFKRNHGCNTTIASEHLLTFRSAAAGYYDLAGDGGTGNLGGFRSGCSSNLIVADGLLNAPDYTRTCTCSYQNQCSLALVHDPRVEMWTFSGLKSDDAPVRRVGINFGAPGDRRADDGTLWLDYPSVGGPSPDIPVLVIPEKVEWFRCHSSAVSGEGLNWVAASGGRGLRMAKITLAKGQSRPRPYTVRLHFAEIERVKPGRRVFNVAIQGSQVLKDFDIVREAGSAHVGIVKEFKGIRVVDDLELTLTPTASDQADEPIICGIDVSEE